MVEDQTHFCMRLCDGPIAAGSLQRVTSSIVALIPSWSPAGYHPSQSRKANSKSNNTHMRSGVGKLYSLNASHR